MPDDIQKVVIQTRAPKGKDPGAIAEGWFKVVDGYVALCDADGIAVSGVDKRPVTPGNERTTAALMLRERHLATARSRSFNRPIQISEYWLALSSATGDGWRSPLHTWRGWRGADFITRRPAHSVGVSS